jgi:hypothetical protein
MKMLTAVAGCCLVGLGLTSFGHAQQPSQSAQQFQLAFCNISAFSRVLIALVHRPDGQRWTVDGWYPIADGGCSVVGNFKGDTVYYFAFGETDDGRNVTWSPPDTDKTASSQCIDPNKFFRINAGTPSCQPGLEPARFRMLKVAPNQTRITWSLTGG